LNQEQETLLKKLAIEAQNKQNLQIVIKELQSVSLRQKELVTHVREEFEAVREDRGNIIQKFNRMMRAVYRLLNQDVSDAFRSEKSIEPEEDLADQSPRGIGRSERHW
jgi:mevalonate kinase